MSMERRPEFRTDENGSNCETFVIVHTKGNATSLPIYSVREEESDGVAQPHGMSPTIGDGTAGGGENYEN